MFKERNLKFTWLPPLALCRSLSSLRMRLLFCSWSVVVPLDETGYIENISIILTGLWITEALSLNNYCSNKASALKRISLSLLFLSLILKPSQSSGGYPYQPFTTWALPRSQNNFISPSSWKESCHFLIKIRKMTQWTGFWGWIWQCNAWIKLLCSNKKTTENIEQLRTHWRNRIIYWSNSQTRSTVRKNVWLPNCCSVNYQGHPDKLVTSLLSQNTLQQSAGR